MGGWWNVWRWRRDSGSFPETMEQQKELMSMQSFATVLVFYICMALNPDVQAKAQAEIDLVTGGSRPVSLDDRSHLPYCLALLKEVSRWHVVVPTGLFRQSGEEEIYNGKCHRSSRTFLSQSASGKCIPARTIVMPNIWYVLPA